MQAEILVILMPNITFNVRNPLCMLKEACSSHIAPGAALQMFDEVNVYICLHSYHSVLASLQFLSMCA